MNRCQKVAYGALQVMFIVQLSLSLLFSVTVILHKNDIEKGSSMSNRFLFVALVSNITMVPSSLCMFFIILRKAHSKDKVGNFRVAKPSASFTVAFVSWIVDILVTLLRGIGIFVCKDNSGPAPWQLTLTGFLLFQTQQCFQIHCIYELEVKARKIREGPEWSTIRKGMYVLLVFFNTYNWLVNLSAVQSLAEVKQKCMEDLLTPSLSHIVHTVGRAANLAFRIECAQLFYKYYSKDKESMEPLHDQNVDGDIGPDLLGHSETGKGRWLGGFLAAMYCGAALTSYVLHHKQQYSDEMILSTVAVAVTTFTVFVTSLFLLHSGERNSSAPDDGRGRLDNISRYIAGSSLSHLRLLLFYSIIAVTYHFVFAMHLSTDNEHYDRQRMTREGLKGITCIFVALFATWGHHRQRKLRTWRALHVMLWMIFTSLFLDLAEECASYSSEDNDNLVLYAFPFAIDFKMFVLIHAISDVQAAKKKFLVELQENYNQSRLPGGNNISGSEQQQLGAGDDISQSSYGSFSSTAVLT